MPYQCADNYGEFCDYLGRISAIITECDTSNIIIAGDFNASRNTQFEEELMNMCASSHLVISDHKWLGPDSGMCTYVSAAHHTSSWLDHCICSHNAHNAIDDMYIHELPPSSDHHPVGSLFSVYIPDAISQTRKAEAHCYNHPVFN